MLYVSWQPTPQYGHTESTCLSGFTSPTPRAGMSAPVGHACTHSPHATHVEPPSGSPAARRCKHALAFDFDHAGAAVAVGPHAFLVAKVRNLDAVPLRRLDDRLVAVRDDGFAV